MIDVHLASHPNFGGGTGIFFVEELGMQIA
jgi:hypothetical protein